MKRIFTSALAAAAVLGAMAQNAIFNSGGVNYQVLDDPGSVAVAPNEETNIYGQTSSLYAGEISIPATVTYEGAAYKVTAVADNAFLKAYDLKGVSLPEGVTKIGAHAFSQCANLAEFNVPADVTEIGKGAFYLCKGVQRFTVSQGNSCYAVANGFLCNSDLTTLVAAPGQISEADIPQTVTEIAPYSFAGCDNLTSVTVPDNTVTLGGSAFYLCKNIGSLTLGESLETIGDMCFYMSEKISSITCRAVTPPALGERALSVNYATCPLYVPAEAIDTYCESPGGGLLTKSWPSARTLASTQWLRKATQTAPCGMT